MIYFTTAEYYYSRYFSILNSLIFILVHPCDLPCKAGCSQICNKKGNGFLCSCKSGFELGEDRKTCIESEYQLFKYISLSDCIYRDILGYYLLIYKIE